MPDIEITFLQYCNIPPVLPGVGFKTSGLEKSGTEEEGLWQTAGRQTEI